jgi:UDP-N-acetylmuramyl pentapeptide phosphotransferase/UDP-N-acetylglucosamine-1-phosphate transferase
MVFAAVVTFLSAALLTPLLTTWAHRNDLLDVPNDRSSHVVATPRIGGVALVASVLGGLALLHVAGRGVRHEARIVIGGAVTIAGLGLLDDLYSLPALTRLLVQAAVAAFVVSVLGPARVAGFTDGAGASFLTVFWIVGLTNAYNFMDGIDGIAGAQGVVAGLGWTAVALLAGSPEIAALGLILAAATGGFLLHNWHPAKVFMGDAGSGFLGFLFASVPLLARSGHPSFFWCALLLMWPFVFDTSFTVLRRARRSENLLSAHRSHIYQRLVLTGRSHTRVTLLYAGLALLGTGAAAATARSSSAGLLLVSGIVIFAAAGALWLYVISREAAGKPPPPRAAAV